MTKQTTQQKGQLITVEEAMAMPIAKLGIKEIKETLQATGVENLLRIHNGKKTQIERNEYRILKSVQETEKFSGNYFVHDNAIADYKDSVRNRRKAYMALLIEKNEREKCGWTMDQVRAAADEFYPDRTEELIDKKIANILEANAKQKAKNAEKAPAKKEVATAANPVRVAL